MGIKKLMAQAAAGLVAGLPLAAPPLGAPVATTDARASAVRDRAPRAALPAEGRLRNPWPAEWEKEFQERRNAILQAQCRLNKAQGLGGRTYFENEKRAYGYLMAHLLAGDRETALKELQREDAQADAWHRHTRGIDYYACFTLKHQVRKYFLFGDLLEPAYKQRMFEGAKLWTEQDPLRRPHYAFVASGPGWGPDAKNSWVDVRTTENLFLMRVTSVYLMAEETGNEATRRLYKNTLLTYARTLYRVGMGEWDSENYHGHSIPPLLNLYDFAKDPEVKAAAKACLDYVTAIGAVKYYRGAFNGPTRRDYNHPQPFGGSAARMLWVYFGDTPRMNLDFEADEVHVLTSSYRPPAAVVHLARKDFPRPAEIFASKPHYSASTTGDLKSPPEHLETHYFGRTFQMGSLAGGSSTGKSDVNGFKILVADERSGALAIQAIPGPDPEYVGSAKYTEGKVAGPNRVAQNRDVALWLVEGGEAPWVWVLPESLQVESRQGVTFLRADRTWLALHPLNLSLPAVNEALTKKLVGSGAKSEWEAHQVLSAQGRGGKYCGIAVEIGEAPAYADYHAFQRAVLGRSRTDASGLAEGVAQHTAANGRAIKIRFGAAPAASEVWRDGRRHDWEEHGRHLFRSADSGAEILLQAWLGGKLNVRAGGKQFTCEVDGQGMATFRYE